MGEHGLELALRHRAQEAGRDADVARRRSQAGGERVRRGVVDDADLRRHGQPGADRDVLDEPAQRPQLVRPERLRVGDPGDHAPRAEDREDRVDAARPTSATTPSETSSTSPTSPASTSEQQDEADDDDAAAQAVRADLLLERHVAGVNDTCGGAVSPSAEKNSFVAEAERPRDEHPGDALDRGVEVHHGRVVVAARGADLVLGVGEVVLEPEEVLGRLELGVGLGDGEEAAERGGQDVVRARRPRRASPACWSAARAFVTSSKTPRSWAA